MLKPYSHVAWNEKGNALRKLGRQEEAMDCYERAIQLDKNDLPFPYVGIADIRGQDSMQQRFSTTIKRWDQRHPWALNGKGSALPGIRRMKPSNLPKRLYAFARNFSFRISSKATSSLSGLHADALGSCRKAFDLIGPSPELREKWRIRSLGALRCSAVKPVGPDNNDHSGIDLLFALLRSEEGRIGFTPLQPISWQGGSRTDRSERRSMLSSERSATLSRTFEETPLDYRKSCFARLLV